MPFSGCFTRRRRHEARAESYRIVSVSPSRADTGVIIVNRAGGDTVIHAAVESDSPRASNIAVNKSGGTATHATVESDSPRANSHWGQ